MYVYIRNNQGFYNVGFFHPTSGEWFSESEWPSSNEAANRIHWLNEVEENASAIIHYPDGRVVHKF